jgi:hypothetical protein
MAAVSSAIGGLSLFLVEAIQRKVLPPFQLSLMRVIVQFPSPMLF